jgi:diguanylate cyclase (GGDEF)-like protein
MLDTATLRVAFGVVAFTMFVLFYVVTYRTTRSAYCGWWCASLALFVVGASAYLFDGTAHQGWANPLGNVLIVLGAGCAWAGARSLRTSSPVWWQLGAMPAAVGLLSVIDDPANNTWSGGPFFLGAMWVLFGLAAAELWWLQRAQAPDPESSGEIYRLALRSMTVGCALVAGYYAARWGVFLAVGQEDHLFTTYFGGQATTLISTVLLATVSFSMSTLSNEQQTAALRHRATRDGLTGLLNRTEFLRLAGAELRRMRRTHRRAQLILADLDHFKMINDEHGHLAGDHALATFADACTAAVRSTDLVARYGGEEFILLLVGASPERAAQVTSAIDAGMRMTSSVDDVRLPTISYGIATLEPSVALERTIGFADSALYRAKAAGRNRSIHHVTELA